jgi:surface protein
MVFLFIQPPAMIAMIHHTNKIDIIYMATVFSNKNDLEQAINDYLNNPTTSFPPISTWDVSTITDMSNLFNNKIDTPQKNMKINNIVNWDVSNVENMSNMFSGCVAFNQSLVSLSEDQRRINSWNVRNVRDMSGMFSGCSSFNQPLERWDVRNVENMSNMFSGCVAFNQSLLFQSEEDEDTYGWQVDNVRNMSGMFRGCINFNQPLNYWDVRNVRDMNNMFSGCSNFNQHLNTWEVDLVIDMSNMFSGCIIFNKPLNNWDVRNVRDMSGMFSGCSSFNQPLNDWNVNNVTNHTDMFNDCIISEENKPQFIQQGIPINNHIHIDIPAPPDEDEDEDEVGMPTGMAFHIHNEFQGINLNKVLQIVEIDPVTQQPWDASAHFPFGSPNNPGDVSIFKNLFDSMVDYIYGSDTHLSTTRTGGNRIVTSTSLITIEPIQIPKQHMLDGIDAIFYKLTNSGVYYNPGYELLLRTIRNMVQFMWKHQDPSIFGTSSEITQEERRNIAKEFIRNYMIDFVHGCLTAYNNSSGTMSSILPNGAAEQLETRRNEILRSASCVKGLMERLITSSGGAIPNDMSKLQSIESKYSTLSNIILKLDVIQMEQINEYLKDDYERISKILMDVETAENEGKIDEFFQTEDGEYLRLIANMPEPERLDYIAKEIIARIKSTGKSFQKSEEEIVAYIVTSLSVFTEYTDSELAKYKTTFLKKESVRGGGGKYKPLSSEAFKIKLLQAKILWENIINKVDKNDNSCVKKFKGGKSLVNTLKKLKYIKKKPTTKTRKPKNRKTKTRKTKNNYNPTKLLTKKSLRAKRNITKTRKRSRKPVRRLKKRYTRKNTKR